MGEKKAEYVRVIWGEFRGAGFIPEEWYMSEMKSYAAPAVGAYSLRGTPEIALDTHFAYTILSNLYLPKGRTFMTEQENQGDEPLEDSGDKQEGGESSPAQSQAQEESQVQEELKQLKLYAVGTFTSFVAFVVFVFILEWSSQLSDAWPARFVAWILTVFAAICCISGGAKTTVRYVKHLKLGRDIKSAAGFLKRLFRRKD